MSWQVVEGDCVEQMQAMEESSVDAIVTDPLSPYGLEFMGKEWDRFAPQVTTARVQRGDAGNTKREAESPGGRHAKSGTAGVRSTFKCRNCGGWSGTFSTARRKRQRPCECEQPDYDYAGAPPALLAFQAWSTEWATEALRVLKPGGHLLAFGGTRTYHRLACAVEDAGFEIRDSIAHLHTLDVGKAVGILEAWQRWSASNAGMRFVDEEGGSAPAPVLLNTSLEKSPADATIAELRSSEARRTGAASWRSALSDADATTTESSALVTIVGRSSESPEVTPSTEDSSARLDVWDWLDGSTVARLKGAGALKIWLGSNESSRQAATDALCAALTDDLRLITCAHSKTFQSYDTTLQMVCVSATNATTTASTAGNLIAFTADTLARRGGDAREASVGPLAWVYGSGFP